MALKPGQQPRSWKRNSGSQKEQWSALWLESQRGTRSETQSLGKKQKSEMSFTKSKQRNGDGQVILRDAKITGGPTKSQNGPQEHTPEAEADKVGVGWMRLKGPKA